MEGLLLTSFILLGTFLQLDGNVLICVWVWCAGLLSLCVVAGKKI